MVWLLVIGMILLSLPISIVGAIKIYEILEWLGEE